MRYALMGLLGGFFFAFATPAAAPASYPLLSLATSTGLSYNWAGYVAEDSGPYSGVSGRWIVPAVAPQAGVAADAAWVGIGGVDSVDLIQAGTQAIVDRHGTVAYQAWLELMPEPSVPLPIDISPGDEVAVSLQQIASDRWSIQVDNKTSGASYHTEVTYNSSNSSAEWIEEMPATLGGEFIPLSEFGAVRFVSASATVDGDTKTAHQLGGEPLTMINRLGQTLADTSVLSDTSGFIVTRSDAQPTPRRSMSRYAPPRETYR